jgi:hypothetical protein
MKHISWNLFLSCAGGDFNQLFNCCRRYFRHFDGLIGLFGRESTSILRADRESMNSMALKYIWVAYQSCISFKSVAPHTIKTGFDQHISLYPSIVLCKVDFFHSLILAPLFFWPAQCPAWCECQLCGKKQNPCLSWALH